MYSHIVCALLSLLPNITVILSMWDEWWTYDGISGPSRWGSYNTEWELCDKGRFQSPIDINPTRMIFDPNLQPLNITNEKIDGVLMNTGHDIRISLNKSHGSQINITGGPLSYKYTIYQIKLHLGTENDKGSEHKVAGKAFPAEIQLLAYNSELYANVTHAKKSPYGIAVVAILAALKDLGNQHFSVLVRAAEKLNAKGLFTDLYKFSVSEILPTTLSYITYEGSLTQPGCQETATWVILNRPMYISNYQLEKLRGLTRGNGIGDPLMENNFRPVQPDNRRLVRTNIPVKEEPDCDIKKTTSYTVNNKLKPS